MSVGAWQRIGGWKADEERELPLLPMPAETQRLNFLSLSTQIILNVETECC
jgi:hypothetical protein